MWRWALAYLTPIGLAVFGSLVRLVRRKAAGENVTRWRVAAELLSGSFVGLVIALLGVITKTDPLWIGVMSALSGMYTEKALKRFEELWDERVNGGQL